MKILIIMIKNIINNNGIIQLNIEKLQKIKEIINRLFWEISNFILNYQCSYGFKDNKSDKIIYLDYKNKIEKLINELSILINDFFYYDIEFNPDNFDDEINISINLSIKDSKSFEYSSKFYYPSSIEFNDKFGDNSSKENEFPFKCFKCSNNNPKFLCTNCNILFCEKCFKDPQHCCSNKNLIINFQENEEKEKTLFLNSISAIFKNILIKCDYLLKNESKKNAKIKKKIKFPYISNFSLKEEIKFLEDIEKEIDLELNFKNSFDISEIKSNLINIIKQILDKDKDSILNLYNYSEIEDDDESSGELINE